MARYLLPSELQMNLRRSHPASLLAPLGLLLCGTVACAVLSAAFPHGEDLAIIWSAWTLILLNLIRSVLDWSVTFITVTSRRLLAIRGLMVRRVMMVPKGSGGTERYFERSLFGRIFGYGTLTFTGSHSTKLIRIKHAPDPALLYREVLAVAQREEVERRAGVRRNR